MIPKISLRDALANKDLLGHALVGESFAAWRAVLIGLMGEELTDEEAVIFERHTERKPPAERVREANFICGRRSGKDTATATLVAYLAGCVEWPSLSRGEIGKVICVGPDTSQALIQSRYILGVLEASPLLSKRIINATADSIELDNQIRIEVRGCSYRRLRGSTAIAIVCSESAFWHDENSSNPDSEILQALRPCVATTTGMIFQISSPYAKRGTLFDSYRRYWGKEGSTLIVKGETRAFNPTIPEAEIVRAYAEDPDAARAEFGGEFRDDIQAFVSRETVEACVSEGVRERQPSAAFSYKAFVDPSGGSVDSFALCVGHWESDMVVVDALHEIHAPFAPESAVEELCETLRRFRISTVSGDRYAGAWPSDSFGRRRFCTSPRNWTPRVCSRNCCRD
jgi:hypothetical protein